MAHVLITRTMRNALRVADLEVVRHLPIMAHLHRSVATLRVMGDTLIPDEITTLLGAQRSHAQTKSDQLVGLKTGRVRIAKSGMWRLHASERHSEEDRKSVV